MPLVTFPWFNKTVRVEYDAEGWSFRKPALQYTVLLNGVIKVLPGDLAPPVLPQAPD
jgi:hypothetical protein